MRLRQLPSALLLVMAACVGPLPAPPPSLHGLSGVRPDPVGSTSIGLSGGANGPVAFGHLEARVSHQLDRVVSVGGEAVTSLTYHHGGRLFLQANPGGNRHFAWTAGLGGGVVPFEPYVTMDLGLRVGGSAGP